jgi:hypothetical protein
LAPPPLAPPLAALVRCYQTIPIFA